MMKRIKKMYGSVDKMLEVNKSSLSRSYVYQILSGEKTNITIETAKELMYMLKLESLDDVANMLENINNGGK